MIVTSFTSQSQPFPWWKNGAREDEIWERLFRYRSSRQLSSRSECFRGFAGTGNWTNEVARIIGSAISVGLSGNHPCTVARLSCAAVAQQRNFAKRSGTTEYLPNSGVDQVWWLVLDLSRFVPARTGRREMEGKSGHASEADAGGSDASSFLSVAQRERIERNRQRARSLRASRLVRPYPERSNAPEVAERKRAVELIDTGGGFLLEEEDDEPAMQRVTQVVSDPRKYCCQPFFPANVPMWKHLTFFLISYRFHGENDVFSPILP